MEEHKSRQKSRSSKSLAVMLGLFALSAVVVPGCGDDDEGVQGYCEDGQCECAGNACICPANGDCGIDCTADCDLQCAGSGACNFSCGEDCEVRCTGSGNCVADVGSRSHVDCPSNGNCEAFCVGPCSMTCTGSGDCKLRCSEGETPTECGGDTIACGGCP